MVDDADKNQRAGIGCTTKPARRKKLVEE